MADAATDFISNFMNGTTMGIPNIIFIAILVGGFIGVYMLATRKTKPKEFKPTDVKKETKVRYKREYGYFGKPANVNLYDPSDEKKPLAYVIGYMPCMEMNALKRYEPIWTNFPKERLAAKHEQAALEVYNKAYADLNEIEKKNIDEVAREELRNEKVDVISQNETIKIVRGRKEVPFSEEVPLFVLKVCKPEFVSKLLARFLGMGIDFYELRSDQIRFDFEAKRANLTATYQRRLANNIFVFSKEALHHVQDISYGLEREAIWQETANQIPRAVHFDTEASKQLVYRREDAKIEKDKRRAQSEYHDM